MHTFAHICQLVKWGDGCVCNFVFKAALGLCSSLM